jgi:hypothetical protein
LRKLGNGAITVAPVLVSCKISWGSNLAFPSASALGDCVPPSRHRNPAVEGRSDAYDMQQHALLTSSAPSSDYAVEPSQQSQSFHTLPSIRPLHEHFQAASGSKLTEGGGQGIRPLEILQFTQLPRIFAVYATREPGLEILHISAQGPAINRAVTRPHSDIPGLSSRIGRVTLNPPRQRFACRMPSTAAGSGPPWTRTAPSA